MRGGTSRMYNRKRVCGVYIFCDSNRSEGVKVCKFYQMSCGEFSIFPWHQPSLPLLHLRVVN